MRRSFRTAPRREENPHVEKPRVLTSQGSGQSAGSVAEHGASLGRRGEDPGVPAPGQPLSDVQAGRPGEGEQAGRAVAKVVICHLSFAEDQ